MAHSASKVLMGNIDQTFKHVESKAGNIAAGTIVRLKNDGTISVAKADGAPLGISLGKDLSDAGFTSYAMSGTRVPILLTAAFTPTVGAQVNISDTTGLAIASGAGATGVNATYLTGKLTAIKEDGTEDATNGCALIHMPGGL